MRFILSLLLTTSLTLGLTAQGQNLKRSDTISLSINGRFLGFSNNIRVEFPVRNSSLGVYFYHTFRPGAPTLYVGSDSKKSIIGEYRYFLPMNHATNKQYFLGIMGAYQWIKHASQDEGVYDSDWYESEQKSIGGLVGIKYYWGQRIVLEGYLNVYRARRTGYLGTNEDDQGNFIKPIILEYAEGNFLDFHLGSAICIYLFDKSR